MRTLILFRHAKAAPAAPGQGDESRGLTRRGQREGAEAGAALFAHGFNPDQVLVSTSVRTRETAACAFGERDLAFEYSPGLYLAGPEALWDAFAGAAAKTIVVLAHNPGLAELASHLIADARDHSVRARAVQEDFPTSAWAAFAVTGDILAAPGARFLDAWRPDRG